jgi:hypothetical protein
MSSAKPFRIRVRVLDGKPREPNKLRGRLAASHMDVIDVKNGIEFDFCAAKEAHLDAIRPKLAGAGLEEMSGGDTGVDLAAQSGADGGRGAEPARATRPSQPGVTGPPTPAPQIAGNVAGANAAPSLEKKPYAFVPLPDEFITASPVWHDGSGAADRLSGEIRCELVTLTPLLVGWERRGIGDIAEPWPVPWTRAGGADLNAFLQRAALQAHPDAPNPNHQGTVVRARRDYVDGLRGNVVLIEGVGRTIKTKSVLCPLRAPWGERPVLLPSDSLKGLLRHELGALLGAPMERVAERSYSYRPNLSYPLRPDGRFLEPRLARVTSSTTIAIEGKEWPFPDRVDVLIMATRYDQTYYPRRERNAARGWDVINPPAASEPYKGGLGGGRRLPDAVLSTDAQRRMIHTHLDIGGLHVDRANVSIPNTVGSAYARTLTHLLDPENGHFSARHPNVGTDQGVQRAAVKAIRDAACSAFSPGDLIWVEWDTSKRRIVSLGWHYYYRWAYTDTVRRPKWSLERHGLFPLPQERDVDDDGAPRGLSPVRRLFGYTGDNEGSNGIGKDDHQQLMGRLSVNAAIEVVEGGDTADKRFLPPTFLRELGMPRPSAVEHYLEQPYYPRQRPSDRAQLVTYGDAAGDDEPGKLAGRKFYLDRADAYIGEPWKDDSAANRLNDRSTLALEASKPGRRFRFTIRFRDLDPGDVAAVLTALCLHQFREVLGGTHADGYCSKLGYARPLGWGSVRIEAKTLLLLSSPSDKPVLTPVADVLDWIRRNLQPKPAVLLPWLAIHRCKHPEAGDYPRGGDDQIYSYHTRLRAEHSRARRYT